MSRRLCLLILVVLAVTVNAKKSWKMANKARHHRRQAGCGPREFTCSRGWCIQLGWQCDTEKDCPDGSDEIGCPTDCTGPHQIKCSNSSCITREYRCDGDNDCGDNTDETNCGLVKCSANEMQCNNRVCIEKTWICDGDDDCSDGSDERNCR